MSDLRVSIADRLPLLKRRQWIMKSIRSFFDARGYMEIETPYLVKTPGEEVHLHPFHSVYETPQGEKHNLFLHTSPEFSMKKVMAEIHQPIFQLARVWRNQEGGNIHSSEFTMLEWYRPNCSLGDLMDETELLLKRLLPPYIDYNHYKLDFTKPFQRLTIQQAFEIYVGIDLLDLPEDVALLAKAAKVDARNNETWEDLFFRLLLEKVEPNIGRQNPTFLTHWPLSQAALAKKDPLDPRVALRFELYAGGLELANAFEELTDPLEQRKRFAYDRQRRSELYPEMKYWEMDEELLLSLEKLPVCSGIAMGVDRLVMLATGVTNIQNILWV